MQFFRNGSSGLVFLPELAAGLGDGATHTLRSQLLQPLPCQGWDRGFESRFPLQIQEERSRKGAFFVLV